MTALKAFVVCGCLAGAAATAAAQTATRVAVPERPGRVELAVAGVWAGNANLGNASAALTPNLNGGAYALFDAAATYESPLGGEARISYRLWPWLLVGVTGSWLSGDVAVRLGGDTEGGTPSSFTGEVLGQGQLEGRADVLLTGWRFWRRRATPYVTASAGALRQWHEGRVHVDMGTIVQGGAGLRYGLLTRAGPKVRTFRVGAAAEVRVSRIGGGFHWGREARTMPSARLECFVGFGR